LEESKQRTQSLSRDFARPSKISRKSSRPTKMRSDLDAKNTAFDKCAENNLQLLDIKPIFESYEHVGVFTRPVPSSRSPSSRAPAWTISSLRPAPGRRVEGQTRTPEARAAREMRAARENRAASIAA